MRRSTRAYLTRAPCRAGCGRPMRYKSALRRPEASFLRRAPLGATCQLRPSTTNQRRASCGAGISALVVTRDEAQHSSFLNARAVPRWLLSSRVVPKRTAPSRGLFPSARACSATFQLHPPTQSHRFVSRAAQLRLRSRSLGCGAALEHAARARRAALGVVDLHLTMTPHRREASLLRCAPVV